MNYGRRISVIIVAAGRGERLGDGAPKQYRLLCGRSVLARAVDSIRAALPDAALQVVIGDGQLELYRRAIGDLILPEPVIGGATRQESVRRGLEAASPADLVLVHDAARPFVDTTTLRALVEALASGDADAVAPGLCVHDSLKRCDTSGLVTGSPDREGLWRVQTPQGFRYDQLLAAHRLSTGQSVGTDDLALAERAGLRVKLIPGDETAFKITTIDDLRRAEQIVLSRLHDIRTGQGYDVHAFGTGTFVTLCGLRIPHGQGLAGHSDADVALHALTDAILGAIGAQDIGAHFPPSDAAWRGASSDRFLKHACDLVLNKGGMIAHADVTIICEAPKIAPHREAMIGRIAEIMQIGRDRVSVKATTTEGLGFTGRREGIAAMATATVRLPI